MRIRDLIKRYLPSYRTEARMMEKMDALRRDLREMDKKNEYLFMLSQMQPGETLDDVRKRVHLMLPKATGRLRDIQMAENYILCRVKDICDANGMELFLVGGTLMGAVRHKGFIPWDNDIDIGMMKHDYLKLRSLLEQDEELVVQYCYNYKEGLKTSKVKFRGVDVFFIDILVFDYIDVTPETLNQVWVATQNANKDHIRKIRELAGDLKERKFCRPMANPEMDRQTAKFEAEQLKEFPCFGHGDYFCEPINCPWWSRDERGIRKVSDYFPLMKDHVEFEGRTYDVWMNYDRALGFSYGDYWKLPFSVSEPHTTEFDEGLEEGFAYLRSRGII